MPKIPAERIISVGNAAFDGALLALISKTSRTRTFFLPGVVEHLELSTRVDFQEEFVNALNF